MSQPWIRGAIEEDAAIILRIAQGDLRSMGLLFDRYGADVRRFVTWLRVPASEADDVVQSTFLDVIAAAARYDNRLPAKPWLFGLAAMHVRRRKRSLLRAAARLARWSNDPKEPTPTPAEELDRKESLASVLHALDRLSPKKRDVFVMFALEHLDGETIARSLGIPIATVWTRLHHARAELRHALLRKERP